MAVEKRTKTIVVVMENYLYKKTSIITNAVIDFINVM